METTIEGRASNGQFTAGNKGGPGRPRRAVEADYLKELSDALSMDAWREICQRAIDDARQGDKAAREWVSKFALGAQPGTLEQLAVDELTGVAIDDVLVSSAGRAIALATGGAAPWAELRPFDARENAIERAAKREQDEAEAAARDLRRAKRIARAAARTHADAGTGS